MAEAVGYLARRFARRRGGQKRSEDSTNCLKLRNRRIPILRCRPGVCHLLCRSEVSHIQGLQQHLEQFGTHIRRALSTAAARFAHMRGIP